VNRDNHESMGHAWKEHKEKVYKRFKNPESRKQYQEKNSNFVGKKKK
jgi:hypothetical protein